MRPRKQVAPAVSCKVERRKRLALPHVAARQSKGAPPLVLAVFSKIFSGKLSPPMWLPLAFRHLTSSISKGHPHLEQSGILSSVKSMNAHGCKFSERPRCPGSTFLKVQEVQDLQLFPPDALPGKSMKQRGRDGGSQKGSQMNFYKAERQSPTSSCSKYFGAGVLPTTIIGTTLAEEKGRLSQTHMSCVSGTLSAG